MSYYFLLVDGIIGIVIRFESRLLAFDDPARANKRKVKKENEVEEKDRPLAGREIVDRRLVAADLVRPGDL